MSSALASANLANTIDLCSNSLNNLLPSVPCSYAVNSIRKRKVKFAIQIDIEELLSVPYVNGVLFCKVRLCDGGNHVSYSSKKEVNNSKVLWLDDSAIQFDVKVVQLYSLATSSPNLHKNDQKLIILGYEPCFCRISVRKELRGGKSYQKLGYVDYNLSEYILNYQQHYEHEFCANRILKEYDTNSKKNQQRLDNSVLKIKIRIVTQNAENFASISPKLTISDSNIRQTDISTSSSESPSLRKSDPSSDKPSSIQSQSMTNTSLMNGKPQVHTHTRNLSLSSNIGSNGYVVDQNHSPYGHNRSCSNGSIKSNISLDFLLKNRNNKLIEDIQTASSSSSFGNSGLIISTQSNSYSLLNSNFKQEMASLSNSSSILSNNGKNSFVNSSSSTSSIPVVNGIISNLGNSGQNSLLGSRVETANQRIIETRVDPNEIISEIESELSSRLNGKVMS
ncbi:hypothetical protein BpHYR1_044089 [Brachionus plicatilis]|uniref:C2 NT-type domain-containing protein n=1 Tax=Brachionus plicatilis TaxID=10195 RepID=A0A3M7RP32_BRAPC|nr:hypothetical protein BpHYR1_044089 [Brachionus plicatilis]